MFKSIVLPGIAATVWCMTNPASAIFAFEPPVFYLTGQSPQGIAAGHLDHNGSVDLVVVNYGINKVSVLSGRGDGTFAAAVNYATGTSPIAVAAGDINNDRQLDVVTANYYSSNLSTLLGNGNGALQPSVAVPMYDNPYHLAMADLNNDARLDVVCVHRDDMIATGGLVMVRLGNGDGTFANSISYPAGRQLTHVAIEKLNGDDFPDLVITDFHSTGFYYMAGNGNGTFQPADFIEAQGINSSCAKIADMNADGKRDVIVANYSNASVSLMYGHGDGTFDLRGKYNPGNGPFDLGVADFNRDGKLDLVSANMLQQISVLPGTDDGFFASEPFNSGPNPAGIAIGDFNADGARDIATSNVSTNTVAVLMNATPGAACFNPPAEAESGINIVGQLFNVSPNQTSKGAKISMELIMQQAGTSNTAVLPASKARVSLVDDPNACAQPILTKILKMKRGKLGDTGESLPVLKKLTLKYKGAAAGLFLKVELDLLNQTQESNERNNVFYYGPL